MCDGFIPLCTLAGNAYEGVENSLTRRVFVLVFFCPQAQRADYEPLYSGLVNRVSEGWGPGRLCVAWSLARSSGVLIIGVVCHNVNKNQLQKKERLWPFADQTLSPTPPLPPG